MKKIVSIGIVAILCLFSFAGCANKENDMKITYTNITAEEAKVLMDTESDYIILDTRTDEEFAEGHI